MSKVLNNINDKIEAGTTNVFADMDLPDSAELLVKAELAFKINQIIKSKKLKQTAAAELLEADQSKISLLNRGRLSSFSIERLVKYLNLLNQDVDIVIRKAKRRTQPGTLKVIYGT